jgi:hypothetical protein
MPATVQLILSKLRRIDYIEAIHVSRPPFSQGTAPQIMGHSGAQAFASPAHNCMH